MALTHFDKNGRPQMVDVSEKQPTTRKAVAEATVRVSAETLAHIQSGQNKKGDVFAVSQLAGIQAAKRTWDLIPLCHPIALTGATVTHQVLENTPAIHITATVRCTGQTGVEMEALTAASVAALTIIDMCKAVQKDITIQDIRLIEKTGGKSDVQSNSYHSE